MTKAIVALIAQITRERAKNPFKNAGTMPKLHYGRDKVNKTIAASNRIGGTIVRRLFH